MPQKCHVVNCTKPVVSKGLCDTHRKRLARHGSTEHQRPDDWGRREAHPAYGAWCNLRRYHRASIPATWLSDFWAFVRDVPSRPAGKCSIARPRPGEPWGADNFFWKEPRLPRAALDDRAAYARDWQRAIREANPNYGKDAFLLRRYGVTLAWYEERHAAQNGLCAICHQPETMRIKGKPVSLAVDHCHETGRVRGLLCSSCNRAVGLLKHDEQLLLSAIAYLKD